MCLPGRHQRLRKCLLRVLPALPQRPDLSEQWQLRPHLSAPVVPNGVRLFCEHRRRFVLQAQSIAMCGRAAGMSGGDSSVSPRRILSIDPVRTRRRPGEPLRALVLELTGGASSMAQQFPGVLLLTERRFPGPGVA